MLVLKRYRQSLKQARPQGTIIARANHAIKFATDSRNSLIEIWFPIVQRRLRRTLSLVLPASFKRPIKRKLSTLISRLPRLPKKELQVRRFLHPKLTLEELFAILKRRNIRYVVLRWFEDLPSVQEGEDIDLLIDDKDLGKISSLFVDRPAGQAFDIYSVSGVSGADYRDLPYYPPHLAEEILESRIWQNNLYAVPDPRRHFLSLAYHVVFHKGENSGLPNHKEPKVLIPDHDYIELLQSLAKGLGIRWAFDEFSDFYDYLKTQEWTPEFDTMRMLSKHNPWLHAFIPDSPFDLSKGEMMVFVVREWALNHARLDFIVETLKDHDLDVLMVHKLSREEIKAATRRLRGGKWDKGPYPASSGLPACLIICSYFHPAPLSQEGLCDYPFVRNKHVFLKHKIRDDINVEMLSFFHTNCIHSADDELEAWEYVRHAIPWYVDELKTQIDLRRNSSRSPHQVQELV